jgi:alkanesulfonate monooxygenase SsuD/methylene tetrahydromethanopterin reductase-like flavin-dependent oxidoreductase (luciferase family)
VPLPLQRPIPIWMGGAGRQITSAAPREAVVLDRIGRLGDGWIIAGATPPEQLAASFGAIKASALAAGRDPDSLGLQMIADVATPADLDTFLDDVGVWHSIGATHVSVRTAQRNRPLEDHLEVLRAMGSYIEMARAITSS